jgi:NADH-quinone oxidoreductase subunit C
VDITNEYVRNEITAQFGDAILYAEEPYEMLTILVDKNKLFEIIKWLKEHPTLQFGFLTDLCGMHFPDKKDQELGMVYHLHSLVHNFRLRIKCMFPVLNPHIASLTSLFASANWQERETYDFYGIVFDGHPNLKRIMNVDEMDYFPMRKEYPLEDGTRTDKEDKYFGR